MNISNISTCYATYGHRHIHTHINNYKNIPTFKLMIIHSHLHTLLYTYMKAQVSIQIHLQSHTNMHQSTKFSECTRIIISFRIYTPSSHNRIFSRSLLIYTLVRYLRRQFEFIELHCHPRAFINLQLKPNFMFFGSSPQWSYIRFTRMHDISRKHRRLQQCNL